MYPFYYVPAQNNNINGTYSNATSSDIVLFLDSNKMKFLVYKSESSDSQPQDIIVTYNYAIGSISFEQNYIICNDEKTQKKYKLKALNEELLRNYNMPFLGDTLYVIMKPKSPKDGKRYMGRWKNGKKDGYWRFIPNKGESYYKLYKNGKLIKTGDLKDLK